MIIFDHKSQRLIFSVSLKFFDILLCPNMEYQKPKTYYQSKTNDFVLAHGDCFKLLKEFDFNFDMIFADPPYFLSNGGISLQNGKIVCVDKGDWDKGRSQEDMMDFNMEWLRLCRDKLKDNGTIWISGTYHNIFSVANCLTALGYKVLNVITWQKTNPPANISCRFFTYSTEFVIWARKKQKVAHKFNYGLMKELNDGKQMTDVWRMPAIGTWEKTCGKHSTQKPLRLLVRMILASTNQGRLDTRPFQRKLYNRHCSQLVWQTICRTGAGREVLPTKHGTARGNRKPDKLRPARQAYRRLASSARL